MAFDAYPGRPMSIKLDQALKMIEVPRNPLATVNPNLTFRVQFSGFSGFVCA